MSSTECSWTHHLRKLRARPKVCFPAGRFQAGTHGSPCANPDNGFLPRHNQQRCETAELHFARGLSCCSRLYLLDFTFPLHYVKEIGGALISSELAIPFVTSRFAAKVTTC